MLLRIFSGSLFFFLAIKMVQPIDFKEADHQNNGADGPGNGIRPGDRFQPVDILNSHGDVADPKNAPHSQHDDHRQGRFSRTPQDAGDTMGRCQQEIEGCNGSHMARTEIHHHRVIIEKSDQLWR